MHCRFFFFNDTATTEIYTLSLHDALPIYQDHQRDASGIYDDVPLGAELASVRGVWARFLAPRGLGTEEPSMRSEEHTSELQSHSDLVCRLLLEKKKM